MSLDLYLGPMFAGKSSVALAILRRNKMIQRRTLVIKSALDNRYSKDAKIVSHNLESFPAIATNSLKDLLDTDDYRAAECILIDEAQFFEGLKSFVLWAVDVDKKHVICVGLDGDSSRGKFGELLDLIPYSDSVQKLKALCRRCGDGTEAIFTWRRPGEPTTQVNVGSQGQYEALCRKHCLGDS